MLTLGLDTASDVCAVALLDDERPLVDLAVLTPRAHAARLAPLISEALAHAGAAPADLDAIAVSAGPGSYTGLRIGLSMAKGLCLATGAALAAVPTLDALAGAALETADDGDGIIVATRSRRGEVYGAAFKRQSGGLLTLRDSAPVLVADLADWLPEMPRAWVLGDARDTVLDLLPHSARPLTTRPSGLVIAQRGRARVLAGEAVDVATFEPSYLKPFEASRPRAIFPETAS